MLALVWVRRWVMLLATSLTKALLYPLLVVMDQTQALALVDQVVDHLISMVMDILVETKADAISKWTTQLRR